MGFVGDIEDYKTGRYYQIMKLTRAEVIATVKSARGQGETPNLRRADLWWVDLNQANLQGSDSSQAYLRRANLSQANLQGTNLGEADLSRANLRGANLRQAKLGSVDFHEADLRQADLSETDLRGANLRRAKFDDDTLWPTDFDPVEEGAKRG